MNRSDLTAAVAEKTGLNKTQTDKVIAALQEVITDELKSGGKVQITGFGVFEGKMRKARNVRNPATQAIIEVPATRAVVFRPGKTLKDTVAGE